MNKIDREKLTKLINVEDGTKWWSPEDFQTSIRKQLPIELEIISIPPSRAGNYNCFVFAFGFENDREFLGGQNPIQSEFVHHLLSENILKVIDKPLPGSLVFYEDNAGTITHGGILKSKDSVISKWMWGAIIVHGIWDVPSTFGDKVFYCAPVESNIIKETYMAYRDSGVKIQPIG